MMTRSTITDHQGRGTARLAAIQALYALEVSGGPLEPVLADILEKQPSALVKPDGAFLRTLVEGVVAARPEIDVAIEAALTGHWTLPRLEILLQAILRAGAHELAAHPEIPDKVVINEYVEIAHAFFSGKEPGLVNAVLDRLATSMRSTAPAAPDDAGRGPA